MYYVYILHLANNQLYTGFTSDLKRRIKEHEGGKVESTKHKRPLKLLHYEAYLLESDARRREKYLKGSEGKNSLRKQIRDILLSLNKEL
ncbi:MAG: GIY-YIG nuclease family protein [Pseudomonadota bacterium]